MEALSLRGVETHLKPPGYNLSETQHQKKYNTNPYYRFDSLSQAMLAYYNQHWSDIKVGIGSPFDFMSSL